MRFASLMLPALALALGAGSAQAGGIERTTLPWSILWEEGNYAQLSFAHVSPHASGVVGPVSSGNALDDYTQFSLGVKIALNERFDLALVLDEPIGSDTIYPASATPYPLAGSTGILRSRALSLLARYRFDNGFSLHGGIVAQRTSGRATLPIFGYTMEAPAQTDLGYLVGVAWEKPEIALRVALTYESAIRHRFTAYETLSGTAIADPMPLEIPQSLTLEFQSGIAADTLVFGSIRWRDWSAFEINPARYALMGQGPLAAYDHDSVTWTLGVGRRLNDNWSAALSFAHERHFGDPVGNLGPYDGLNAVTLGLRYTQDRLRVETGVTYAWLGNATTRIVNARFTGSHALGLGLSVGYGF